MGSAGWAKYHGLWGRRVVAGWAHWVGAFNLDGHERGIPTGLGARFHEHGDLRWVTIEQRA